MARNCKQDKEKKIENLKVKQSPSETPSIDKDTKITTATTVPLDGGYGWVIVFSGFMCCVVIFGILYSFGILLVYFVEYFESTKGEIAWIGSLFNGCIYLTGPLGAILVNRFSCRTVVIIGSLISTSAFLLSTAVSNIKFLTFTYGILGGIGFGLINMSLTVSISTYFCTKRAFATAIAACGASVGIFIIPPFVDFLLKTYNWQGTLIILSGLPLNCIVFGSLLRPLTFNNNKSFLHQRNQSGTSATKTVTVPLMETPDAFSERTIKSNFTHYTKSEESAMPRIKKANSEMSFEHNSQLFHEMRVAHKTGNLTTSTEFYSESVEAEKLVSGKTTIKNKRHGKNIGGLTHSKATFYSDSNMINISKVRNSKIRHHEEECLTNSCSIQNGMLSNSIKALDVALLKERVFLILCFAYLIGMMGVFIPAMYLSHMSIKKGINREKSVLLLSTLAIAIFSGRLVFGFIIDRIKGSALNVDIIGTFFSGVTCIVIPFSANYSAIVCFTFAYGFFMSPILCVVNIILVDMLGLKKLAASFGLLNLFQGVGVLIGPPIAGAIFDATNNYDIPFCIAGIQLVTCASLQAFVSWTLRQRVKEIPQHDIEVIVAE